MKKLIVLVAAMVMIATSAYAAEWNFYGSARVSTFWNTFDFDTAGVSDVDSFALGLQGNSRIGANVKVSDELTGRFEVGNSASTWNTRIIWGEWNFGGGSLGIGQHYTPLCMFYSNQVYGSDSDLLGWGGVYSGRQPMLQLKYSGFKVALTSVSTGVGAGFAGNTEVEMPAIEASYDLKLGMASLSLAGGYQTFDVGNESVDAYVVALGAGMNFGPAYLNGNIWTGQNAGNLMWVDSAGTSTLAAYSGTNVLDNDSIGYLVVLGGKINDMFSLEFGYAGLSSELDGSTMDQDSESYYGQVTINLAPGVAITPEVGVIDYDGTSQRKETYYGAKWQINF